VVGAGTPWSQREWQKTFDSWSAHGDEYGLFLRENRLNQYRIDAGLAPGAEFVAGLPPDLTPEQLANESYARRHRAQTALYYYQSNRSLTNFPFYLAIAQGEQQKETVEARKVLWKADQERRLGNNLPAGRLYVKGLEMWRGVLANNPNFHRSERLQKIEEDTCEYELEYLRLIAFSDPQGVVRPKARQEYANAYARTAATAAAAIPFGAPAPAPKEIPFALQDKWYLETAEKFFSPFAGNITAKDVPPGDPRIDTPWVNGFIREMILQRQGALRAPTAPQPGAPPGQPGAAPLPGPGGTPPEGGQKPN
jgi:hypothetical protein